LTDERLSSEAVFFHGKEFLLSIQIGLEKFDVYENNTATADLHNLNRYEDMVSTYLYDSHTSYSLKNDLSSYRNLDDKNHLLSFGSIREYEDNYIVQCGFDKPIIEGTILVGSSHGSWARDQAVEQDVARTLGNLLLHPTHLATRIDKGLTLLRKVIRTEQHQGIGDEVCSKLHTESIHPLELFSTMRIKSIGESPFQHVYSKEDPTQRTDSSERISSNFGDISSNSRQGGRLLSPILRPESPVQACKGSSNDNGDDLSSSYNILPTKCSLGFNAQVPGSFNFNYDTIKGECAFSGVQSLYCKKQYDLMQIKIRYYVPDEDLGLCLFCSAILVTYDAHSTYSPLWTGF
jgi:hypothetical protein